MLLNCFSDVLAAITAKISCDQKPLCANTSLRQRNSKQVSGSYLKNRVVIMNANTTSELRLALISELLRICPTISNRRAINYINSYVNEVMGEIACGMQYDDIDGEFQFRLKKVQQSLKQIKINDDRAWMFTYFSNYEALRLVTTVMKGHTGRNSKVILSDRYVHMIIDELSDYLSNLYKSMTPASIKSNFANANIFIPIDVDSLNAFITKCGDTAKQSTEGRYKQKIIENKSPPTIILAG